MADIEMEERTVMEKTSTESQKMQKASTGCMQKPLLDREWVRHHDDLKADTPIMRFMPRKYFLEMIKTCRNTLMHVSNWADVYEGLIYKQKYFTMDVVNNEKSPVSLLKLYGGFLGQCWTKAKYDSELLWNARCPNKDGVCIKTTYGRLSASVERIMPSDYLRACCRLDKVVYWDEALLNKRVKEIAADALASSDALVDLFFVKRNSFRDENEVRLLYFRDNGDSNSPSTRGFYAKTELVQYEISKDAFLTEVVLDPRMSVDECQAIKCAVCKANWRCNGTPLQVNQSSLYKATVNEIFL